MKEKFQILLSDIREAIQGDLTDLSGEAFFLVKWLELKLPEKDFDLLIQELKTPLEPVGFPPRRKPPEVKHIPVDTSDGIGTPPISKPVFEFGPFQFVKSDEDYWIRKELKNEYKETLKPYLNTELEILKKAGSHKLLFEKRVDENIELRIPQKYVSLANYEISSSKERKKIAKRLIEAVCALHTSEIVHYQLNPESVFIDPADHGIRFLNPGLKVALPGLKTTDRKNFAPEQVGAGGKPGVRTDYFGLGLCLLFIFTGEINSKYVSEVRNKEWRKLISACLKVNPADRPANCKAIHRYIRNKTVPLLAGSVFFLLLLLVTGLFIKDKLIPQKQFVIASNLILRKCADLDESCKTNEEIPYGQEVEVFEGPEGWKIFEQKGQKFFLSEEYLMAEDEFKIMNSMFRNDEARECARDSYIKLALWEYFKTHGLIGNLPIKDQIKYFGRGMLMDMWVLEGLPENSTYNKCHTANLTATSGEVARTMIIEQINGDGKRLLVFNTGKDATTKLELDFPVNTLGGEYLKLITSPREAKGIPQSYSYGISQKKPALLILDGEKKVKGLAVFNGSEFQVVEIEICTDEGIDNCRTWLTELQTSSRYCKSYENKSHCAKARQSFQKIIDGCKCPESKIFQEKARKIYP